MICGPWGWCGKLNLHVVNWQTHTVAREMHEWELVGTHVSDTDDFELVEIDAAMTDTISRRRQLEDKDSSCM